MPAPASRTNGLSGPKLLSILAALCTVLLMLAAGMTVRDRFLQHARADAENILNSFAEFKQAQLRDWLRNIAAQSAQPAGGLLAQTLSTLAPTDNPEALRERLAWLVERSNEYQSAWLLDAHGQVVMALHDRPLPTIDTNLLERVRANGKSLIQDFYLDERGRPALATVTPLMQRATHGGAVVGIIVIEIDPARRLYQILERGTLVDAPRETFLARREGEAVRYLSPLVGEPQPLALQITHPAPDLLALGEPDTSVVEGSDYRNTPVLGVTRHLPEMGWILVTKMDRDAVYAKAHQEFVGIALRFGAVALFLASLVWMAIRQTRTENHLREVSADLERTRLEKLFNFFVRYAKDIVLLMDESGNIVEVNETACHAYGFSRDELIGMNIVRLCATDQPDGPTTPVAPPHAHEGVIDTTAPDSVTYTTTHRRRDGTAFPVEVSAGVFEHEGRRYRQSIVRDISNREAAARALAHSEARFRGFFELAMVGLAQIAVDRRWLKVNPAFCDILGFEPQALLATEWSTLVHPDDLDIESQLFGEILEGRRDAYQLTLRFIDARGWVIWGSVALRALRDEHGQVEYCVLIMEDITFLKDREDQLRQALDEQLELNRRLEEAQGQLLQSEKMASIGQLAAGVAHEINNPVGFVSSNLGTLGNYVGTLLEIIDRMRLRFGEDPELAELLRAGEFDYVREDAPALLGESLEGIARVRKIVQDLKDFSRVGDTDWQWADLHHGLDSTINVVWNEIKYKATLDKAYGDLPQIWCLPSQLNQVFLNLLVNAAHAITAPGTITVRTGASDEDVWIEIGDTGCGIAKEHLGKLFDPFFTTKPIGQGTGLGLSLTFSIIKKHRGQIEVRSEVGTGTTFRVTLPVVPPGSTPGANDLTSHREEAA